MRRSLLLFGVLGLISVACGRVEPVGDDGSAAELVRALRAHGAEVDSAGAARQPFLDQAGQALLVNGERVEVYAFASVDYAVRAAASIPTDGTSFERLSVDWVAPPHFFHSERLIVLYVGESADVLAGLRSLLGPEFAGAPYGASSVDGSARPP